MQKETLYKTSVISCGMSQRSVSSYGSTPLTQVGKGKYSDGEMGKGESENGGSGNGESELSPCVIVETEIRVPATENSELSQVRPLSNLE